MTTQVNQQSDAVKEMAEEWAVIDALMGGTLAMRKAGKTHLPQLPAEADEDYKHRLATATLFPAFARTVSVMAGKPFAKQITIGESVPSAVRALLPDIDDRGSSLHTFAATAFTEYVAYGFCGILVDYTKTSGQARTVADEKAIGARPYWVLYRHGQILSLEHDERGEKLTQVRLLEFVKVKDGEFGSTQVEQVRVLEPGVWRLYRSDEKGAWNVHDEGVTTLDYIPFAPLIANPVNREKGFPPLRNLAHLNVKHWQAQSLQDRTTAQAGQRLLVFTGLTDSGAVVISSDQALRLPPNADAKVVQGSAEAVSVGRSELEALEAQMIQTGAELLTAKPGQRTATEASNDAEASKSDLQRMVEGFEDFGADLSLQMTADWLKAGEGGAATLYSDYASNTLSDASAQLVVTMGQAGQITQETVLREMQRRGVLSPDLNVEDEAGKAREGVPSLGGIGGE